MNNNIGYVEKFISSQIKCKARGIHHFYKKKMDEMKKFFEEKIENEFQMGRKKEDEMNNEIKMWKQRFLDVKLVLWNIDPKMNIKSFGGIPNISGNDNLIAVDSGFGSTVSGSTASPSSDITVNPISGLTDNQVSGITVNPVSGRTVNPVSGRIVNQFSGSTVNPTSDRTVNPVSGSAVNPASICIVNPVSGSTVNPASGCIVNPASGSTANPISARNVNPVSGSTVKPSSGCTVFPVSDCTVNLVPGSTVNPAKCSTVNQVAGPVISGSTENPVSGSTVNPVYGRTINHVFEIQNCGSKPVMCNSVLIAIKHFPAYPKLCCNCSIRDLLDTVILDKEHGKDRNPKKKKEKER